jgi:hypothetical protein
MTNPTQEKHPGVLGGGARVLRELLRSSRITGTARVLLSNLDPEAAPELVRAALFGDTALSFDLLSATPQLVNAVALGARELAAQLLGFPVRLVDRLLPRLARELDAEALGEAAILWVLALVRLTGRDQRAFAEALVALEAGAARGCERALAEREVAEAELLSDVVARALAVADGAATRLDGALLDDGALAQAVSRLADGVRQLASDHPTLMTRLVRPLASACCDVLEG